MSLSLPTLFAKAFAYAGDKNVIPSDASSPFASLHDGFPTITSQTLAEGGVPPDRKDFNGIFNEITSLLVWMNSGKPFPFNSTLATAIGGYDKGSVLILDDGETLVQATADGTTGDPNSSMTGWQRVYPTTVAFADLPTAVKGYDFPLFFAGKPLNSQLIFGCPVLRACTINATGNQGYAYTTATGSSVFNVYKNSTSIGTVTFAAGTNAPTFSITETNFDAGDRLRVVAPSSADATLADIAISFQGVTRA